MLAWAATRRQWAGSAKLATLREQLQVMASVWNKEESVSVIIVTARE